MTTVEPVGPLRQNSGQVTPSPEIDHYGPSPTELTPAKGRVDLQSVDYESIVDQHLICPICQCVFVDPMSTPCGHTFCRACIEAAMTAQAGHELPDSKHTKYICPVDRIAFEGLLVPSFALRGLLDNLVVLCPNTCQGCEAKFPRWQAETHLRFDCDYASEPCVPPCELLTEKRWRRAGRCPHRLTSCVLGCGKSLPLSELETHNGSPGPHRSTCELADQFEEPVSSTTLDCPGKALGCTVAGVAADASHLSSCSLALIATQLAKQQTQISELVDRNRVLENFVLMNQHDNTATIQQHRAEVSTSLDRAEEQIAQQELSLGRLANMQSHCVARLAETDEILSLHRGFNQHIYSALDELKASVSYLSPPFRPPLVPGPYNASRLRPSFHPNNHWLSIPLGGLSYHNGGQDFSAGATHPGNNTAGPQATTEASPASLETSDVSGNRSFTGDSQSIRDQAGQSSASGPNLASPAVEMFGHPIDMTPKPTPPQVRQRDQFLRMNRL